MKLCTIDRLQRGAVGMAMFDGVKSFAKAGLLERVSRRGLHRCQCTLESAGAALWTNLRFFCFFSSVALKGDLAYN